MSTQAKPTSARSAYQLRLFSGLPLYTTRLVREAVFTFPEREQVSCPDDVAAVLQEYFADKDREAFIVVFLDTANNPHGASCRFYRRAGRKQS